MPLDRIIALLQNSGFRVFGADQGMIWLEDPTCFTRSIADLAYYIWLALAVMTAFLLMGWAISLIRGANTKIMENFKVLILVLGAASAAPLAANAIWGGDLFGQGCKKIGVPIATVEKILADIKNAKLKSFDADDLYEEFSIYDSAAETRSPSLFKGDESIPAGDFEPGQDGIIVAGDPTRTGAADVWVNNLSAINAEIGPGNTVIFTRPDGSRFQKAGGTLAWRQNNPGNIENSPFARRMGAVDGPRFAIFPDEQTGMQAIKQLLRAPSYNRLTVAGAINRWAPPFENDTANYQRQIERLTGIPVDTQMSSLDDAGLQRMAEAIRRIEGWQPGTINEI